MSLAIRLLGRPSLEVGGATREMAGKKPWGLLAYLALAESPRRRYARRQTRRQTPG